MAWSRERRLRAIAVFLAFLLLGGLLFSLLGAIR